MLPSEMDDKHLVNCIRLLDSRFTNPQESSPLYNAMVMEASDRGIATNTRKREELEFDKAMAGQQLNSMKFIKRMKKVRKGAEAIKQVKVREVKVVDIRARRIILED